VEKRNYGKTYMGVERSAFVIDADGVLAAEKRRIKPDQTVEWALDQAGRLGAAAAG
jgi:peroxiredoxin Q/BCP